MRVQLLAAALILTVPAVYAQPPPAKPAAAPLLYRLEFMPDSVFKQQKRALVPVKRTEFEELLKAAQDRRDDVPGAWIESAHYQAELQGNALMGEARLKIAARSVEPVLLSLAELRLGIQQARWEGDPEQPAVVGMTPEGQLQLLVPRSGTLAFQWKLLGRSDPWQAAIFDLSLAEASRSTLSLELPADWRLESSAGIAASEPAGNERSRWNVELGSEHQARVRCAPESLAHSGPVVLVTEECSGTVALGEIEVQCQLRLDVYREPIHELEVELIGGWQPTAVRQGDRRIPFELRTQKQSTALLRFDPPLFGANRRLSLTGRALLDDDGRAAAPRARIKAAAWLAGTLSLSGDKVQLVDWELSGLDRPNDEGMSPAGLLRWRMLNESASASFRVLSPAAGLKAASGSTIRLDADSATATVVTDFTADSPGVFELESDLAAAWIVDSVEAESSGATVLDGTGTRWIEDWEVVPRGARQRLRIALAKPVAPNQPLRIRVKTHRAPPSARESLSADQLRPLRWLAEAKGQLAISIDPGLRVDLRGIDRLRPADPGQLTPAETARLDLAEDVLLLADDEAFAAGRYLLAEESPQFSAAWRVRVAGDANQVREEMDLRVTPRSSPVERFHVLVRPPAGKDLAWELAGDDASLEARLVRSGTGPADEDEWELVLGRARRNPFVLRGAFTSRPAASWSVRLPRCVEAANQSGEVEVAREAAAHWKVERIAALEKLWNDPGREAVSCWSYEPTQNAALVLRAASAGELQQLLLIERAELETRLAQQDLIHEAIYTIESQQAQSLSFRDRKSVV